MIETELLDVSPISIVILCVLLFWISISMEMDYYKKRQMMVCIEVTMVVAFAELGCTIANGRAENYRFANILCHVVGFSFSPFILLQESRFFLNREKKESLYPRFILATINVLLAVISAFTGWYFSVTEDNLYHRGPLFLIYILIFLFSLFISVIQKFISVRNYPNYLKKMIISIGSLVLLGAVIQMIFPNLHVTWLAVTVYLVFYYALSNEIASMVDGMTGLLNQKSYHKQIEYLEKNGRAKAIIIMIDVNDFKQVNDHNGHDYGDYCLKEIAKILVRSFRKYGKIFRYGGDEFCVVMQSTSLRTLEKCIIELKTNIMKKQKRSEKIFPGVSIGYERYTGKESIYEVVKKADQYMYQDKRLEKEKKKKFQGEKVVAE